MKARQREGIADARAAGRYKGRKPTARAKAADAVRLFREGHKVS
jgi:DNA invertase Pin-like site-specific DNA recombinase